MGLSDGASTEVLSGLNEGDWIARRVFTIQAAQKSGFSFLPDWSGGKNSKKKK